MEAARYAQKCGRSVRLAELARRLLFRGIPRTAIARAAGVIGTP
jgi:hypothetical protein